MDNSESELLDEWDVVTVSSVYQAEKENDAKESIDADTTDNVAETGNNMNTGGDFNINTVNGMAKTEGDATAESKSNTVTETDIRVQTQSKMDSETEPVSNVEAEHESSIEVEPESNAEAEIESNYEAEPESDIEDEPETVIEAEPEKSAASPEPECSAATKSESFTVTLPVRSAVVQPESSAEAECDRNTQFENSDSAEQKEDTEIKAEIIADEKSIEYNNEAAEQDPEKNITEVTEPVLDSSLMGFEIEDYIQDAPELVPDRVEVEQEMAAIESSSSDIDIIDENVEESITSSFISPLSLSISSSVADTSSIHSFTPQSSDSRDFRTEPKIEEIKRKEDIKKREYVEKEKSKPTPQTEKSYYEDKSENVHSRRHQPQRTTTTNSQSYFNWFTWLVELFRNMSGYDWCVVGGITVTLYLTIIVHQTNIFAIVQKDNAVSQMKDMIEELKHDNKILKEQMLLEMKKDGDERVLSSFEHQIRELRKENTKLNHMLYDVAKVLDKQKDSQEKKEAEYLAPLKKEINKLKEHINVLKIDNEELQKQLVRMRYSSYSQGGKDSTESEDRVKKREASYKTEREAEEIPLESLKKWNELITLLTNELGALSRGEGLKDKKHQSEEAKNAETPFWKGFVNDFKSFYDVLSKMNIRDVIADYKKSNQKAAADVYKSVKESVKDFFTVDKTQPLTSDNSCQWKSIGDFVNDLKEKWGNIKDRLLTSDLQEFVEKFRKKAVRESSIPEDYKINAESTRFEQRTDSRHTHAEPENNKQDKPPSPEDTKWMFKRAAHREEQRNTEEEVNWFLKKGKHDSEDGKGRRL